MKEKVIFFGNGPLAEAALWVLGGHFEIIYHAKNKADLEVVKKMKAEEPKAHGILASYGVMIKDDILKLFEPEGILNIHPSLLPKYRGASPIESAILAGDDDFSVSIMKLVRKMDAGPIYYQTTLKGLPLSKAEIYDALATAGAEWIVKNIDSLPEPVEQIDTEATFTEKLDKTMGVIHPESETAEEILRKIIAFQGFPKTKYVFFETNCIILDAHICGPEEIVPLFLDCADGKKLSIDTLQPEGRKPMDAKSFLNGYAKR